MKFSGYSASATILEDRTQHYIILEKDKERGWNDNFFDEENYMLPPSKTYSNN